MTADEFEVLCTEREVPTKGAARATQHTAHDPCRPRSCDLYLRLASEYKQRHGVVGDGAGYLAPLRQRNSPAAEIEVSVNYKTWVLATSVNRPSTFVRA